MSTKPFRLAFVFTCLVLIILHPYTQYGKPGMLVAISLAMYGLYHGVKKQFAMAFLAPAAVLVVIGTIGVFNSALNGIFQLNHLLAAISFNVLLFSAYGLWVYCQRWGISKDEIIAAVLLVIVLNSAIISLELFSHPLRLFIESFLDPLEGGSINYAQGYRLRGLATSGGAGLSISVPVALVLSFYLFERKILSFVLLLPVVAILLFSVQVIGRTGLILAAVPLITYTILAFKRKRTVYALVKVSVLLPVILLSSILLYRFVVDYYTDAFGESFVHYAFGFLLKGMEGIKEEGTTGMVAEFLTVLPLELPQALVGYGFYGGSEFTPWTDSGFSRMFLSVGFVFGLLFYAIIYRIYFCALRGNEFLLGTSILILAIAELKEPLLFSGVASRMFIFILIFCWFDKYSRLKMYRAYSVVLPNSDGLVGMHLSKS